MIRHPTSLPSPALLRATLFLLFVVLVGTSSPAWAQSEADEDSFPTLDFAANVMQSAQLLEVDDDNPYIRPELAGSHHGFHRVRAGLNVTAQFHERVSTLVMIESEPNDFGGLSGSSIFDPQVDFVILDLDLTDRLTVRVGTPVTGLMNFRGFSDGPVVQGNPLIGNSPADMITAGQGVKLIGTYDAVDFDLTINRGFGEDFSSEVTGVNLIGKARIEASERLSLGGGLATSTGNYGLVFANGDGENYNFPGTPAASRETHARMPNETILHLDGKLTAGPLSVDGWGGYATQDDVSPYGDDRYQAAFVGVGGTYDLSSSVYAAGRLTYVGDRSDAVEDLESTALSRIQIGVGVRLLDAALLKVEAVRQVEGPNTALSQVRNNWYGLTTELSVNM